MFSFRNVAVNLKASGLQAVVIAWVAGMTLLGIFGTGQVAAFGLAILAVFGFYMVIVLVASHSKKPRIEQNKDAEQGKNETTARAARKKRFSAIDLMIGSKLAFMAFSFLVPLSGLPPGRGGWFGG